ncbi:MAG: alcohol dehydrogenase catalytic domain-containing protein, partial [Dehalococcoidia bacterium]
MRAATWTANGTLDVAERPDPEPKPGWVRLRVAATGICGTDLHFFRGVFGSPAGLLPGHEVGGVVDLPGDGVELEPGTPVAVEPIVTCRECYHCLGGSYNRCPKRMLLGVSGRGGMAEFMTAPAHCLYPLPRPLAPADGALAEPLAVCVRGLRLAGTSQGQRVVILGGGTIGLLSAFLARLSGATEVYITARRPAQQAMARELGATAVFDSSEAAFGALDRTEIDSVVETVGGSAPTLADATRLVRPGGTIVMLGVFEGPASIPALEFSGKEVTLVGSNCYGRSGVDTDFGIAVRLLGQHIEALRPLVTHRFSLDQVNQA